MTIQTQFFSYLETLDRGGLTWPTQELVDVVIKVFCIFQCLVSEAYEQKFLSASNQKKILISLSEKGCLQYSFINSVFDCGHKFSDFLRVIVGKMANIMLNNYCKKMNDLSNICKGAKSKHKRKLSTLKA